MKSLSDIQNNRILSGTFIVTASMFVASVFSYLLQFALARLLSLEEYGTFNSLLSSLNIITVPMMVLSISLIKTVSELKSQLLEDVLSKLYRRLNLYTFVVSVLVISLTYIAKDQIASYLNISDSIYIFYLSMILSINLIAIIPLAYLQGQLQFTKFGAYTMITALMRLIVPIIGIYLGYRMHGVLGGIALAASASLVLATLIIKPNLKPLPYMDVSIYLKQLVYFGFGVLLVNLCITVLNNMDVILVKKFFDSSDAGYYSAIVTVGKILLFGAGSIGVVMYPQIAALRARGEAIVKVFEKFLILQIGIILTGTIAFALFPNVLVNVLFPDSFMNAVPYVPLFSVFMFAYVMSNFLTLFLLALNKSKVFIFMIPVLISQFILINMYHENLFQIININILITTCLLFSLSAYIIFLYRTAQIR